MNEAVSNRKIAEAPRLNFRQIYSGSCADMRAQLRDFRFAPVTGRGAHGLMSERWPGPRLQARRACITISNSRRQAALSIRSRPGRLSQPFAPLPLIPASLKVFTTCQPRRLAIWHNLGILAQRRRTRQRLMSVIGGRTDLAGIRPEVRFWTHSGQRRPPNISCAAHFPTHWTGSLRSVNFYFNVRGQSLWRAPKALLSVPAPEKYAAPRLA
jgi:hypothetical protein